MPNIEDCALLGDLHTAALVSTAGSIDWLCLPRFDSPAAFAALLHNQEAGHWTLAPAAAGTCTARRYAGNTLVLETDWVTADGAVRVIDFMPPRAGTPHLIRIAVGLSGEVAMQSTLRLRFDYGRVVPWVRHHGTRADAIAGPDRIRLMSAVPVRGGDRDTLADFTVHKDDRVSFVMSWAPSHEPEMPHVDPEQALSETEEFWTKWSGEAAYQSGPYRGAVDRSLITLKALTYEPTGGIVAAARVLGTIAAVRRELSDGGLVRRYSTSETDDGVKGSEGLFIACSFWLVDALHASGQQTDAAELFERLLALRNDVGLLSEEWDPAGRRQLGNFPRAFSHFALVVSALQMHMGAAVRSDNPMPV